MKSLVVDADSDAVKSVDVSDSVASVARSISPTNDVETAMAVRGVDAAKAMAATVINIIVDRVDRLISVSDDNICLILSQLELADIASAAASCRHLATIGRSEFLWQHVVLTHWPLLPERVRKSAAANGWEALARARACAPRWRYAYMDELERLVCSLARGGDRRFEHADGDRLAVLACGVFATPPVAYSGGSPRRHPLTQPEGRAWVRTVRTALCAPDVLRALHSWATACESSLDEFYEGCGGSASAGLARRDSLLKALRCASALRYLQDELLLETTTLSGAPDDGSELSDLWRGAGLPSAIERIVSSLESLELEGFNVAVPQSLAPGGLPPSHRWWRARPPLHAHGRLHYC